MTTERRDFLKKSWFVLGGAAATGVLAEAIKSSSAEEGGRAAEGRVVHLPVSGGSSQMPQMRSAADPTGRLGVAGRKWIKVINRAAWVRFLDLSRQMSIFGVVSPFKAFRAVGSCRTCIG